MCGISVIAWTDGRRPVGPALLRRMADALVHLGRMAKAPSRRPGSASASGAWRSSIAGPRAKDYERYSRSVTHLRSQSAGDEVVAPDVLAQLRREADVIDAPPTPEGFAARHPFAQMQYFDLKHRMADVVVLSLDRSSMAHSVEARVPFLDHEFVEFCARIPPRVKMKWLREKHVLRRAMAGVLPPEIAKREKWAMQLPTREWMGGALPPFAASLLADDALRANGCFDPAGIRAVMQRQRAGSEDTTHVLSAAQGVQVWHDVFQRGRRG